ncbi:sigma-70 family RNA polymerase sigma factor [Ideonella sp. A 288]|uniref:sigma-70 family RNA polymerase sigma factor n=1 Tax=Ideonella sp. A 288 TaxID=1962181 RepID=UPI000B4C1540|nr:sigma-70 family RNA polymerase sigma factor [Ideonella sp. A 288]
MNPNDALDALEARLRPQWLQARDGDEAAYRRCLDALARRLRGYFGRRLHGPVDEIEDLVQETLLALHLQRGTYDPTLPLLAWVHAIARHKLVDLLRRHGRKEALHLPLDDLPEALHPSVDDEPDARHDIARLLASLPAAQQHAIVRTKLEGLSVAEAARLGNVSESALKVQVHRGLKKLAERLRGG